MSSAAVLAPGRMLAGRYVLQHLIGEGGMGQVWAATHVPTHSTVALKFIRREYETPEIRRRFLREARAASAVQHPHVVQVHEVVSLEDGTLAMVMELLTGETLARKLRSERGFTLAELATIFVQVASAVGAAHERGIIHRDLKPENIFLTETPGDPLSTNVKVLDFGIAKLTASDGIAARTAGLTETNGVFGTPHYMSPEQAFGEKDIDHRTDIWSLGIILYECLTGVLPITGDNFGQIMKALTTGAIRPIEDLAPGLPKPIARLVGRMLKRRREDRPANLGELMQVMAQFTTTTAPSFGPPLSGPHGPRESVPDDFASQPTIRQSAIYRSEGRALRRKFLMVLGGGAVIGTVGIGLIVASQRSPKPATATATASVTSATPSSDVPSAPEASPIAPAGAIPEAESQSESSAQAPPTTPASSAPGSSAAARSAPTTTARSNGPPPATTATASAPAVRERAQGGIVEHPPF